MAGPLSEIDGGYAVRDNTGMYTVPGAGYVPAESRGPIRHRVDVTDSPLGYVPFVGDALQGWQAKIDYDEGDYLSAGIGAGLLMVPPFVSRVLNKTKPVWGPWARKVLVSGMDRVSDLSPKVRAFLDKYVSGVESDLSKIDIDGIRKSVIDYQKRRDLEKAPLIPGIENDLARYREAGTIPVVPATNRENILNRLGLTESTSGLMRAGAVNDGRRISIFPGNANPGVVGHELRHSIQDEFTGATLPVPSGHTVIGGYRVPKYDFIPLERLPLEDNPALGEVRSILKGYNPESPWHQKITELDAEVERARQLYHPNTSWKELYDMGDERLDKSLDYLRDRFHLQNNDESNYLMKTLYENGYACGGRKYPDGGKFFRTDLGQESPMMYEPMMPVYPEVAVPERYYPQPNYGDYEYPESTGMIQSMPIQVNVPVAEPGYGVMAPMEVPVLDPMKDAARRIMAVENSKANANGGWDAKTGRWYPHRSHEGGADTIAYGIKLSNGTPEAALALRQGYLTDEQAVSAVDTLVQKYYDAAKRVYDGKYGAGEWDKLSDKSQSILVDYSYNPGLAKFPKLMEGFHSGNMDLIRQNYKRYVNGKELGRNKVLLEELDTLGNEYPIFRAKGGGIHINPKNKGKFTALLKRTGKSASWFKEHGTPLQRKRATFALNARKWRHGDGGPLDKYGDDAVRVALSKLKANRFQDGGDSGEKSIWKLPVRVPNMTGTATAAATGLRDIPLIDSTIGKELAVAGTALSTIAGPVAVNWLSNPANQIIASKLAVPLIASETANAGVREYTPFGSWGEGIYYPIRKFNERYLPDIPDWANEAGEFVSEFTNPGFVVLPHSGIIGENMRKGVDKILEYPRGVGKRAAEVAVRMGDIAEVPNRYPKQFFNKNAIRYIFDPKADPELVYRLPFKYSGESSGNLAFGAHKGDIVDQFFGKTHAPNATYDRSVLPERMREYLLKNYPDKNVPIVDIGNAHAPFRWASDLNPRMDETSMQELVEKMTELGPVRTGVRSGGVWKNGRFVLDPGGFDFTATRVPDGYRIDAMDIWKYKPNEYSKAYLGQWSPKRILQRAGLKFIDRQGTPIIHRWNEVVPHLNGM